MRLLISVVLLAALGCSSRYYVRPQHLVAAEQAQATGHGDVSIPALDGDREPTYVWFGSLRKFLATDAYGLQEVRARDSRPGLKITGWITAGMGGVLFLTGIGTYSAGPELDLVTTIVLVQAAIFAAAGLPLLVLGYSLDGPESDRPSPGMPMNL